MNIRRWIAIDLAAVAAASATATTATAATAAAPSAQHAFLQQDLQRDLDAITATGVPGLIRFWSAIGRSTLLPPALTRQMQHTVPASGGDSASVPGSRYGLGIFFIPLSCGGYWSYEGDVPATTPSAPSAATVAPRSSCPSTPTSTTRYRPPNTASSTTSCATTDIDPARADRARHQPKPQRMRPTTHLPFRRQGQMCRAVPTICRGV